jgi:hypothetical protein
VLKWIQFLCYAYGRMPTAEDSGEASNVARRPRRRGARIPLLVYLDPAILAWLRHDAAEFEMPVGKAAARLLEMTIMATKGVVRLEDLPAAPEK